MGEIPLDKRSLVLIGCWRYLKKNQFSHYVEGTFICGARYLAIFEDGTYYDYSEGEILEEGTVMRRGPGIFCFTPNLAEPWELLALGDGTLYRTVDGVILEYEQIMKTPALMKVEDGFTGAGPTGSRSRPAAD